MNWLTIDTAPEGDMPVIVYCPDHCEDEKVMMATRDEWGWRIHIDGQYINPTHWMPRPAAPE